MLRMYHESKEGSVKHKQTLLSKNKKRIYLFNSPPTRALARAVVLIDL